MNIIRKPQELLLVVIGLFILFSCIRDRDFMLSGAKGKFLSSIFGEKGARAFGYIVGAAGLIIGILGISGIIDIRHRIL
jgi:hypothetical protein